jgi:hypothetical protein
MSTPAIHRPHRLRPARIFAYALIASRDALTGRTEEIEA